MANVELPEKGIDLPAYMEKLKHAYINAAMKKAGGNVTQAAEMLGLKRTTMRMWMLSREVQPHLPVSTIIDPEGEFTVSQVAGKYNIYYKGEYIAQRANIKAVNKFIREKING